MVTTDKVELTNSTGFPRRYTCAAGTAIDMFKVLTISDPRTAAEVSDVNQPLGYKCAGIAAMDKEAGDDTSTSITAFTDGIFEVYASGNIAVKSPMKSCGGGYFMQAVAADVASGVICGYALEAGIDEEIIEMRLKI